MQASQICHRIVYVGAPEMSDHEHGKMDASTQENTFNGFVKFWIWLFGFSAFVLIFLAVFNS